MRIVITGGAGFLGSRLARAILERGSAHRCAGRIARYRADRAGGRRAGVGGRSARDQRHRRPRRSGADRARRHGGYRFGLPPRGGRQRAGGSRVRHRHAREPGCDPGAAGALPEIDATAEGGVHQLARGVRRRAARSRARRLAHHAADVLWRAKGHGRVHGLRHDAQGLHRRPLAAAAHRHRASGQAQPRRVLVRERHHPRTAVRRRRGVSGRADCGDVGHLAAIRDRQPDHGSRRRRGRIRQGRLRAHPLGQRAGAARRRRRNDGCLEARRGRSRRCAREVAARPGDRPHRCAPGPRISRRCWGRRSACARIRTSTRSFASTSRTSGRKQPLHDRANRNGGHRADRRAQHRAAGRHHLLPVVGGERADPVFRRHAAVHGGDLRRPRRDLRAAPPDGMVCDGQGRADLRPYGGSGRGHHRHSHRHARRHRAGDLGFLLEVCALRHFAAQRPAGADRAVLVVVHRFAPRARDLFARAAPAQAPLRVRVHAMAGRPDRLLHRAGIPGRRPGGLCCWSWSTSGRRSSPRSRRNDFSR